MGRRAERGLGASGELGAGSRSKESPSARKISGGVYQSSDRPIDCSCSDMGLHFLIEPVVRPAASRNVVTRLRSVRAVPMPRRDLGD